MQPAPLFGRPAITGDEANAFAIQFRQQHFVEQVVLALDQGERTHPQCSEHVAGECPIGTRQRVAERLMMAQQGDPYLEEFVEVGA